MTYNAKSTTTTFNLVVLAFALMLVGGLMAMPIIEEAQAAKPAGRGCEFTPGANASKTRCVH
jgi:hypothetical protein